MEARSINPVLSRVQATEFLNQMPVAPSWTDPVHMHLYKAGPLLPTPDQVVADFTESTFNGYAVKNIAAAAFLPVVNSPNGLAVCFIINLIWVAAAPVAPSEQILGYYLTDVTNANLLFCEAFPTPLNVTQGGDYLDFEFLMPQFMVGSLS